MATLSQRNLLLFYTDIFLFFWNFFKNQGQIVFCSSKPVLNSGERSIKSFPFFSVVSNTKGDQTILYECQVFACSAVLW